MPDRLPRYCYICNASMANVWVCPECVTSFPDHGLIWIGGEPPPRHTPDDPINQQAKRFRARLIPEFMQVSEEL